MKKRLEDTYEDLKEGVEEWSEKTFYAVCSGIKEELGTRKNFPLVMEDTAFEEAIWKVMESTAKSPIEIRVRQPQTVVRERVHSRRAAQEGA